MLFRATSLLTALHWALSCVPEASAAFPDTPFTTDGRDIVSASGEKVVFAGVNWPGQGMTMLPEGLQYNSIANITSIIKQDLGMNVIRLTYAIEMVDDYLGDSPNQSLKATLANALGEDDGATVLEQILDNNPQFTEETTRLEVQIPLLTLSVVAVGHDTGMLNTIVGFRCCCRRGCPSRGVGAA